MKELEFTKDELDSLEATRQDCLKSIKQLRANIVEVHKQYLLNPSSRSLSAKLKKLRGDYKKRMAAYESNKTDLMESILYGD